MKKIEQIIKFGQIREKIEQIVKKIEQIDKNLNR